MEKYNYYEVMYEDVKNAILEYNPEEFNSREDFEEYLYDEFRVNDSVTGNASGSYFCNRWKAEESVCHNWDLLVEAIEFFGWESNDILKGAEWCDVTIRCYLLHDVIYDVLEELNIEFPADREEDTEE